MLVLSNTKHMSTGAAYGAGTCPHMPPPSVTIYRSCSPPPPFPQINPPTGIYTSAELGTSLGYAGHSYGYHGSGSNRLSPNGGAVAVVEYASSDGQTSFIRSANPHVVLSESRAVCVRFLLVPRKDGGGEGK